MSNRALSGKSVAKPCHFYRKRRWKMYTINSNTLILRSIILILLYVTWLHMKHILHLLASNSRWCVVVTSYCFFFAVGVIVNSRLASLSVEGSVAMLC